MGAGARWARAVAILRAMKSGLHMIVLGAGIVGLFTALLLRQRGVAVTVFDPAAQAARQSSWAGGGIVSPLWPWNEPPQVQQWALQAHHVYPDWAERLRVETGIDVEYRRTGICWLLAESEQALAEAWHQQWQLPFTRTASGLSSAQLGQVRNPRLGRALAVAGQLAGVDLQLGTTVEPVLRDGRVIGVRRADGQILPADAVIVAAGAWSAAVMATVGLSCDVQPVKGQMLLFAPTPDAPRLGPVKISRAVYLIPVPMAKSWSAARSNMPASTPPPPTRRVASCTTRPWRCGRTWRAIASPANGPACARAVAQCHKSTSRPSPACGRISGTFATASPWRRPRRPHLWKKCWHRFRAC